jgi:phosphopantothenoylcysteine decarboxylase/phosphopantothenate--cysteine ligase
VTAVVGHVDGDLRSGVPAGCAVRRVGTAEELRSVVHDLVARENPDVVVMAAAVADFRPVTSHPGKITKESLAEGAAPELSLERTTDVLAELAAKRGSSPTPIVVGFAAETPAEGESLTTRALAKLARKGCDYLVANDVSDGAVFGDEETTVAIVGANGECHLRESVSKEIAAHVIWDAVRFDR